MSKQIAFDSVGFIIGKEYSKPTEKWTGKDGKVFEAKEESFNLYVAVGQLREKGNLIGQEPIIVKAQTTKECFKATRNQSTVTCRVVQRNGQYYSFLSLDGISLVNVREEVDEDFDEDEDEDIVNFETLTETTIADGKKSKKGK